MELNEILAISGAPGLYKFVAQGKNGIIVESLADGRRTMIGGATKVSALSDMAVFTEEKEMPLEDVLQAIYDKNTGKPVEVTGKSTPGELQQFLASVVPNYDKDRVHNSDIKKLGLWYNVLVGAGMKSFKAEEEEQTKKEGKATAAKPKATASTAAKKTAAPKKAGASSGAKAPNKRSTTARKAQ